MNASVHKYKCTKVYMKQTYLKKERKKFWQFQRSWPMRERHNLHTTFSGPGAVFACSILTLSDRVIVDHMIDRLACAFLGKHTMWPPMSDHVIT